MKNPNPIRYSAEPYVGRNIGSSFLCRTGWQVVAYDTITGKRRAVFSTSRGRTPCLRIGWVARHFISGRSRKDQLIYNTLQEQAIQKAAALNEQALCIIKG